MTTAVVELSTQQLADRLNVSSRMINLYRTEAERLTGKKIGVKRGKTTYFDAEAQALILKVKNQGVDVDGVRSQHQASQQQQQQNFTSTASRAEEGILVGMDDLVAAGDQNAIAIGQALGVRWQQTMMTAAFTTMQEGMVQFGQQFKELNTSIALAASPSQPQLLGSDPSLPRLESLESEECAPITF